MDKLIKKSPSKLIIIMLVALTFAIVVFCYRTLTSQDTISSIAYSSLKSKDDYRVYIKEDGKYVPFLVIDNGYEEGSTLLLREEILAETKRMNEYSSYYKDSEIDRYLNGSYYENFKGIHSLIESTAVEIYAEASIGRSGDETENINRNIFLLSDKELSYGYGIEGKALRYFRNPDNRLSYLDGTPMGWLLRTPVTSYLSAVCEVSFDGKLSIGNSFGKHGIRPAFCVNSLTKIKKKEGIDDGKKVYVLE